MTCGCLKFLHSERRSESGVADYFEPRFKTPSSLMDSLKQDWRSWRIMDIGTSTGKMRYEKECLTSGGVLSFVT